MDFLALPPEVTSALVHSGPGAGSLIEASAAWQRIGTELGQLGQHLHVGGVFAGGLWDGPSSAAMVQAVPPSSPGCATPLSSAQQMASSTQAAATAFNAAQSAVVTPATVAANRTRLAQLIATDRLRPQPAAIAETEEQYQTMWATTPRR